MSTRWIRATYIDGYTGTKQTRWLNMAAATLIWVRSVEGEVYTYVRFDNMEEGPFEETPEYFMGWIGEKVLS